MKKLCHDITRLFALFRFNLKMKLTALCFLVSLFGLHASNSYSQKTVTLKLKDVQVSQLLDLIENQTEYHFVYRVKDVNLTRKIQVNAQSEEVSDVLDKIFKGTDTKYEFYEDQIFLTRRPAKLSSNTAPINLQEVITVKGIVTEAKTGMPVPATNILEVGTTNGVMSDFDGNYSIEVSEGATLKVSYIGYATQEVEVNGRNEIDIALEQDAAALDEVVVVGYGTTSNRMNVSSVTSLKTDEIEDLPFTNTGDALQGRAPGVVIQSGGGEPGSNPTISIRGGGPPLYVIDGVIRDENDFNSINPSDIEQINVLKDASATAVYGARAGDGIVLVQTKRGKEGEMQIRYSGGIDFSQPAVFPDKMNAYDYVQSVNKAAEYDGRDPIYSSEDIDKILNNSDPYGKITANTDWRDLALNEFSVGHRHNISMSGASENGIKFYTALGYLKQNSIFKESHNNEYDRANLRSNVSKDFEDIGLEVSLNIDGAVENRNPTVWGNYTVWSQIQNVKPNYAAFNPDGTYSSISVHPLAILDEKAGYNDVQDKYINTQLNLQWEVPSVQGLSVGVLGNVRYKDFNQKIFQSKAPQYQPDGTKVPYTSNYLRMTNDHSTQTSLDVNIQYRKSWGFHNIELQGVSSFYKSNGENFWAQREKYLSSNFDQLFAGDASTQKNYGFGRESARLGYVGRVKYDWNKRYMFEGNFRIDKSDNFAPNKRTGFFPSGAVAWAVSEESFMSNLKNSGIIDFLKFRTSYGIVGLEDGARFGYLPVYNMHPESVVIDGSLQTGFSEGPLVSNDLSWYDRQVLNVALDAKTLNNRLSATFEYFYYRTEGYLIAPQNEYNTPLGKEFPLVKSESAHRRAGYEGSIRWQDNIGDFDYQIGLNLTSYDELWEKKEDESLSTLMDPNKRETHAKNYYGRAYKTNGLYQSMNEIINNPRRETANELKPGDLIFEDLNGDGKIDGEDFQRIGKPTFPTFSYGVDFNINYKNFGLSGLLQGTGERYMQLQEFMRGSNTEYITYDFQKDFWTPENPDASFPRVSTYQNLNAGQNYSASSDFWYRNAAYLRLKSLQLSYDFNELLGEDSFISSLRLVIAGTNLFTISDVTEYFDPEITSQSGYAYPIQRTFSTSLNVTF